MNSHEEPIELETGGAIRGSVIWLHGLGADGSDFAPIVAELGLDEAGIRFIFPHAPYRPITINNKMVMRGWFDILEFSLESAQDEVGIRESAAILAHLIQTEIQRGIPSERIVVAGFSQGGAIALHEGLRHPHKLAGVMALSCFLPLESSFESERHPANQHTSIFMAHGSYDPVLPMSFGTLSRNRMKSQGYEVIWRDYPMPHSVCPQEIKDIASWLTQVLPV